MTTGMSTEAWLIIIAIILIGAAFLIFHAKIAAFFTGLHTKLDTIIAAQEKNVKADIADVGAEVSSVKNILIAHHDDLTPDINAIKAAVLPSAVAGLAIPNAPATPVTRRVSTDHLDDPTAANALPVGASASASTLVPTPPIL